MSKAYHYQSTDFGEGSPHYYSQEASTLRLAPGEWPSEFTVENLGNEKPFRYLRTTQAGNYLYQQDESDVQILIFND